MNNLVTIETYTYVGQADVARAELEKAGIQAFLADDNLIQMDWFLGNAVGGVKLQVAEEDAEDALQIIEQIKRRRNDSTLPKISFDCENCGKPLEFEGKRRGGVETCRHCGQYVDVPE